MKTSATLVLGLALLGVVAHVPRAFAACPTALPDSLQVNTGGSVNFQLPASDPDGDALTYIITAPAAHGSVVVATATGAGTYTPNPGYCGPDSFRFKVNDGVCDSAEATVAITVACPPPNQCPTADDLPVTVAQNGSVNFDLPASDPDDDPLQYTVTQPAAHGVVVVQSQTGAASYTPNRGYCGPDSFKFRVGDGECNSDEATVSITVTCAPPALGCRVTGGAVSTSGNTDPNLSFEITSAKGSGQVGAPCGSVGCFEEAGHILGVWQHSRRKRRGNFLAKQFTSLACSCLNADGTASFGAPCRPDDPAVGPELPAAPANVACFSGIGNYSDSGRKRATRVAFRVEVEDHGEPGAGGTAPDDVYRIRIWIPQTGETVDQLAADACCCNPEPTNGASRRPDVDDGGPITHGNIQIHPQTPAQFEDCPVPDDSCPLCGNGQVDGDEDCDPPGSTCRGGCNPVTQTCVDFKCGVDCTCPAPACGDQFVDAGEECDPPASTCGDGRTCNASCACEQVCGNGNVEPGEDCEPPNTPNGCTDGRSCDATCQCVQQCGNGSVEGTEDCEPPNDLGGCAGGLSCNATCECVQVCGNDHREPGEECDPSPDSPRGGCGPGSECVACECVSTCGNGEKDMGEVCDASASIDNCPLGFECNGNCACVTQCGNGTTDPGEQCEPPNTANGCGGNVSCNATCQCTETCNNGFCGAGEDSCNCPTDCPNDPTSCSPCECGASAGFGNVCGCDFGCGSAGNCCVNACSLCGNCSGD